MATKKRRLRRHALGAARSPRCPKSLVNKLVEAAGRNQIAARDNGAPYKAQDRLQKAMMRALDRVQKRCPNYDTTSDKFWSDLDAAATRWNNNRTYRGPGVDW